MVWHVGRVISRGQRQVICMAGQTLLEVDNLQAKIVATGQKILKGVTLTIKEGEVWHPPATFPPHISHPPAGAACSHAWMQYPRFRTCVCEGVLACVGVLWEGGGGVHECVRVVCLADGVLLW